MRLPKEQVRPISALILAINLQPAFADDLSCRLDDKMPLTAVFYSRLLNEGRPILSFDPCCMMQDREFTVEKLGSTPAEKLRAIGERDPDAAERVAYEHALQCKGRFMLYLMQSVMPDVRLKGFGSPSPPNCRSQQ
jgi:hypothetical protein